ncbi:MAG: ATP-binding protein [Acidobacteriota bacterium]
MAAKHHAKIFAGRPSADFVGRDSEVDRLVEHAGLGADEGGLLVLAAPGAGATELLRQTYDRLFHEQREIIPFYFSIRRNLTSGREMAEDFLQEFIRQLVAFRRHDPAIVRSAPGLEELAELSLSVSGIWIDRLISIARNASGGRTFLRASLSAPIRSAANGDPAFVMIDDAQHLDNFEEGPTVFQELRDVFEHSGVRFVVSGYRRFLHGRMDCRRLELDNLEFENASKLTKIFGRENGVSITEQPCELIAAQLGGNPALMRSLVRDAADSQTDIKSFQQVQKAYADGMYDGRIARRFNELFSTACGSPEIERNVLRLLSDIQSGDEPKLDRELWRRRLQLGEIEAANLLNRLNTYELVGVSANHVESVPGNIPLTDHVSARTRLMTGDSRANIYGDALTEYIKRAPEIMSRHYRANAAIGVREILSAFDGRNVATLLLDYAEFRDEFKAATDEEVLNAAKDAEKVALPRIFFTTSAASFYKPLGQIADSERSAISLGFEARDENANCEIVWIAAEIDAKLEAGHELVEFWCDRLEAAALMCGFAQFRLWLIAPEGFSPLALEILKRRNTYGSSRRQANLLRRVLDAPASRPETLAPNEYEIVIPMDDDAELIAAHAVEEIARRHNLDSRSINQVKTALIEACINASEHSLSPDRKIYQRFRIEHDRIVLTVSNRGLRLTSSLTPNEPDEGRRGWGLKLMRKLMDEVTIEDVDDGTRIVMTKYLKAA